MCTCENQPVLIEGKKVEDIPALAVSLKEIKTDYKKWITEYQCTQCGQKWIERYEPRGRSEVPVIEKVLQAT